MSDCVPENYYRIFLVRKEELAESNTDGRKTVSRIHKIKFPKSVSVE